MDGCNPSQPRFSTSISPPVRSMPRAAATFVGRIGLIAAITTCTLVVRAPAVQPAEPSPSVNFAKSSVGDPPADFGFAVTGPGEPGRWTVVPDSTTDSRVAVEHVSRDINEDRFRLAIYNSLSLKNVAVAVRFKILDGSMQTAGIAVRLSDPRNYYAIGASALDSRVDLSRVVDGRAERITGTDADVFKDHWQTLRLAVDGDRLTVFLDSRFLFAAQDRTFRRDGQIALWTVEDNVTRFDQLEITALPWSEAPR